ncbi:MAG: TlpA family protein disulfide reductase [Cytophagales bacterium]|nr:TlpA family protein disulfide reductase [Cytophagales bacterium]
MKLYCLVGMGIFYFCSHAYGQSDKTPLGHVGTKTLEFGDSVPDLMLSPIVNYKKQTAKISDFNDQLLILDFWATWCVPCIRPFPKLDSLQRQFQGRLQFMLVTAEKRDLIESFFARLKKKHQYVLPSVVEGDSLFKFFTDDSAFDRAYVWIMNGKIVARTDKVSEKDIHHILDGNKVGNAEIVKNRVLKELPYDFSQPLLLTHNSDAGHHIKYYSGFTSFIKGLKPYPYIKRPKPDDKAGGLRMVNLPLSYLYLEAYQLFPIHEVSLEMEDIESFNPPNSKKDSSNLYSYELILGDTELKDLREIMQEDLKRVFGYKVIQEVRNVKVVVLKRTKKEKLATKGEEPFINHTNFYVTLKNRPFKDFTKTLKYFLIEKEIRFFIDETGITKNIDIELDVNMSDPNAVAEELRKYGLNMTVEDRPMKMYVIKDRE